LGLGHRLLLRTRAIVAAHDEMTIGDSGELLTTHRPYLVSSVNLHSYIAEQKIKAFYLAMCQSL